MYNDVEQNDPGENGVNGEMGEEIAGGQGMACVEASNERERADFLGECDFSDPNYIYRDEQSDR